MTLLRLVAIGINVLIAISIVVAAKIHQQYGAHVTPAGEVVELIVERSGGNPFYIEELIDFFRLRNADLGDPSSVAAVDLPDSLQSLVLSRIDTLDGPPRRTLKVASILRKYGVKVAPDEMVINMRGTAEGGGAKGSGSSLGEELRAVGMGQAGVIGLQQP